MNGYIEFNRHSDALSSLDEFCSCLSRIIDNEVIWKYAIISIHSALQGYLCITLSNGDNFQTWKDGQFKKWLMAYRNNSELPIPQLDFFMELFDKVFKTETSIDRHSIEWLNETRNGLIHFNTDGYSIGRESLVACCREALEAIKLTPSLSMGIFFYSEDQENDYDRVCKKADELLSLLHKA